MCCVVKCDEMKVTKGRRAMPSNNLTIALMHVEVTSRSSTLRFVDDARLWQLRGRVTRGRI